MKYAKEYIQTLNESTSGSVTAEELLNLIESLPDSESHIFFDERRKLWNVTQEWLVGGFAGRSFEGKTKEDAALQQIEYLNRHRGHNSIVGNIVTKSGWPDLAKVKMYLTPVEKEEEEDEQELNEAKSKAVWPPVPWRVTTNLDPIFGLPAPSKKYMTPGGWHIKMLGTQTYKDVYDSMTPEQKKHIPAPSNSDPEDEYENDPEKYIKEIGETPSHLIEMGYNLRNDLVLRAGMERDRAKKKTDTLTQLARNLNETFSTSYIAKREKDVDGEYVLFTEEDGPSSDIVIEYNKKSMMYTISSRAYHGKEFDSVEDAVNYIIKVGIIA